MRTILPTVGIITLLFAACERAEHRAAEPAKRSRGEASPAINASTKSSSPAPAIAKEDTPRDERALADQIYETPDEDLADLMETIAGESDSDRRSSALTVVYEETSLRPPAIRLPLLLEVARSKDAPPDLRATVMAELGATLETDHGASWGDWSLALEEHLADTEGLIRVE